MCVFVRLNELSISGFASEAVANMALTTLAQRDDFVGGKVDRPRDPHHHGPHGDQAGESWRLRGFLLATREPAPEGTRPTQLVGAAFRGWGVHAGVVGITWADDLARKVTTPEAWTRAQADFDEQLGAPPCSARVHARIELITDGVRAPTEGQVDLCLDAARQRWADRRAAALKAICDAHQAVAYAAPRSYPRTSERVALENAAWSATHDDFKGVDRAGNRSMLYLNPQNGWTESWPIEWLPTDELRRCARAKASPCTVTLETLDLRQTHGEWPTRANEQVRFREDVEMVKDVTAAATEVELWAFIVAHLGSPAADTGTRQATHDDLAAHAYCLVMDAWWPEREAARLAGGAA